MNAFTIYDKIFLVNLCKIIMSAIAFFMPRDLQKVNF